MKVLALLCLVGVAVAAPQQQHLLREEIIDPPEPYNFDLYVSDDLTTNYQSRTESQDANGVVQGQYSWLAPNGVRYTTTYTADAVNGFQAHTVEEQTNIEVVIPVHRPQPPQQQLQQHQGRL